MEPQMLSLVMQRVSNEMDRVKNSLRGKISSITRNTLIDWDMASIAEAIAQHAPLLTGILHSGAQTDHANRVNTQKDYSTVCSDTIPLICFLIRASPHQACQVMIMQLAKLRSNYSLFFAAPFSLFLWTNGTSHQVIEALARCGLCISFTSLFTLLNQLASQCVDQAIQIAQHPHIFCYDNINISTSIFVEQRSSGPAKVQSGTFPILYAIENVSWDDMRLGPMLHCAHHAADLNFNADICPTK